MSKLKYLFIHCTATPEGRRVSAKEIHDWHIKGRGWSRVGYSDMVHIDGRLENLIPFNQDDFIDRWEVSNGAKGYNGKSRHIVYVGGCEKKRPKGAKWFPSKDTRTEEQKKTLELYIKFMILRHPDIIVLGHRAVCKKDCPSFDVREFLLSIGVELKNIH